MAADLARPAAGRAADRGRRLTAHLRSQRTARGCLRGVRGGVAAPDDLTAPRSCPEPARSGMFAATLTALLLFLTSLRAHRGGHGALSPDLAAPGGRAATLAAGSASPLLLRGQPCSGSWRSTSSSGDKWPVRGHQPGRPVCPGPGRAYRRRSRTAPHLHVHGAIVSAGSLGSRLTPTPPSSTSWL